MSSKLLDIAGAKYGRLSVVQFVGGKKHSYWLCKCDCGAHKVVRGSHLISGNIQSCGCLSIETRTKHGDGNGGEFKKLYASWMSMRRRCRNKNDADYSHYGGRGIQVCDEWMEYSQFKSWALDSGYDDALEIDRIDNNKGYSPDNCHWVTRTINNRNRRPFSNSSSQYMGVSYYKANRNWLARITIDGKQKHIGYFVSELAAAHARDMYVKQNGLSGFTINIKE